jgi:hypothetical protein
MAGGGVSVSGSPAQGQDRDLRTIHLLAYRFDLETVMFLHEVPKMHVPHEAVPETPS